MSQLFGWIAASGEWDAVSVAGAMAAALRVDRRQPCHIWTIDELAIGILERVSYRGDRADLAPAVSDDGRYSLWMAGEAFEDASQRLPLAHVDESRGERFRRALLAGLVERGPDTIRGLDGEYQIALWDRVERSLTLLNDRFGGLPLYHGRSRAGFAFAGGVRGVLMAPEIPMDPDVDAIREAVTFGGFRLGDRTNVSAVKMLPGASRLFVRDGRMARARYWRWHEMPEPTAASVDEAVEEVHHRWRSSVRQRLGGAGAPGQTLSGGLDSRAVLAEAAPQSARWTAITYGVAGAEDVRIAERAAARAGVAWIFHPLYGEGSDDWLARRTAYIQQTDGLIDLTDLMHLDALPLQAERLDVHLSGYIGDAVSGPTFNACAGAEDVALALPFYGAPIGYGYEDAVAIARGLVEDVAPAAARFALFEHKLPQSTNRWPAAWRPWLPVRKPFTAYRFFEYCQGLPPRVRGAGALHERWLATKYPALFASIPNQKTGAPVLSPAWKVQAARGRRAIGRRLRGVLERAGVRGAARPRSYHPDEVYWRTPAAHAQIECAILRPESISGDAFGRAALASLLRDWFTRAAAPTQVIGALYTYECYHRGLAAHLAAARADRPAAAAAPALKLS